MSEKQTFGNILDGKAESAKIKAEIKAEVAQLKSKGKQVTLAVVLVGDDPASEIYVNSKIKTCAEIGINSVHIKLPADITGEKLIAQIKKLNKDKKVNGILVQLPLPKGLDESAVINALDPLKDVDGLTTINAGTLFTGGQALSPCTPLGCMHLIKSTGVCLEGKNAVVIGRSNLCGKPVAIMLLEANCTVTIAHSRTKNLADVAKTADILVVAVGRPQMVTAEFVKQGAIVIDVGINRVQGSEQRTADSGQGALGSTSGASVTLGQSTRPRDPKSKIVGDVDFDSVKDKASYITKVPGGVGPMTIAMLMQNTLKAYKLQNPK
ncbi:MAG: bifunctional methylenetetrahydrofolate dehydrogenase/methenyltetrahydrofolate cyclohydrolase FolD [Firmicutes bacterium]|nr:bifunctional methylenetetrahydrofolate dehydrogenase/methenyltetrahydrofolate cyclohydrolase FolD [Bacillota bacterium]